MCSLLLISRWNDPRQILLFVSLSQSPAALCRFMSRHSVIWATESKTTFVNPSYLRLHLLPSSRGKQVLSARSAAQPGRCVLSRAVTPDFVNIDRWCENNYRFNKIHIYIHKFEIRWKVHKHTPSSVWGRCLIDLLWHLTARQRHTLTCEERNWCFFIFLS